MRHEADHDHDDSQVANLQPELLDLRQVSRLCQFSPRHVLRMADTGRMPPPVKVGRCARWSRRTIQNWITAGCPQVNTTVDADRHGSPPPCPQNRTRPD